MLPNDVAAVTAFFLLVAPGIVFQALLGRWRPAVTESAFRETSRIVLASTVFTLAAVTVLSMLGAIWPGSMPDPGAWLREGGSYVEVHYRLLARTILLELLLAFAMAASASWLVARRQRAAIKPVGGWYQLFRLDSPKDTVPYVRIRLRSGDVYGGMIVHYSEDVGLPGRELVLGPPLSHRQEGQEAAPLDQGWQRVVIVGTDIEVMWVSYVRRGEKP